MRLSASAWRFQAGLSGYHLTHAGLLLAAYNAEKARWVSDVLAFPF